MTPPLSMRVPTSPPNTPGVERAMGIVTMREPSRFSLAPLAACQNFLGQVPRKLPPLVQRCRFVEAIRREISGWFRAYAQDLGVELKPTRPVWVREVLLRAIDFFAAG